MGTRRKVKPEQAREHELRAWELRQRGYTQERIAQELGLDRSGVSRILARVSERALKELTDQVEQQKVEQTAQLDHVADEMMRAWEESKKPVRSVTRRTTQLPGEKGEGGKDRPPVVAEEVVTQQVEDQTGNVSYIDRYLEALAQKRKLWGLDAPQKHELTGKGGGAILITAIEAVAPPAKGTDDERESSD